jgi:ABC-type amino acid transport system permease subunit
MISTIDESQRKAAKVAGFTSLVTMAIVVVI